MEQYLQQLINGLSVGSVYALMAVGYSLVYSVMNFSNFAHGSVIMLGAYFGFYAFVTFELPWYVAFSAAVMGTGLVAVLIERLAYRSLRQRRAPFLFFIISAMGVSMFIDNLVNATIGPTPKMIPVPEAFGDGPFEFGEISIGRLDVFMFLISAVCLSLLVFFIEKTRTGKAIQAAAYNMKAAALMGINTDRVITIVFALGGILAGLAGVFFGMKYQVSPTISNMTIKSFIAAVFGGLGSLPGAVLGSLLLGVIEGFAGQAFSLYKDLIAFALLLAVLVFRPSGIMGKSAEDKA